MDKQFFDMTKIQLDLNGKSLLGDEHLQTLFSENASTAGAGLYDELYTTPNGDFCTLTNENNCKGTTNVRCANEWMCGDSANRQCNNDSSCQTTRNAAACTNAFVSGCAGADNP